MDKGSLTQFGRAMAQLGVEMVPAYSPEARGRSERAFGTHQGRLPKELALAGATDMESANRCLAEACGPAFNAEFAQPAREPGSAFVPCRDLAALDDVLCEVHERAAGRDNCVRFDGLALQLPADRHRAHCMRARVKVRRHADGTLSVWHGPRRLAKHASTGEPLADGELAAAAWRHAERSAPEPAAGLRASGCGRSAPFAGGPKPDQDPKRDWLQAPAAGMQTCAAESAKALPAPPQQKRTVYLF